MLPPFRANNALIKKLIDGEISYDWKFYLVKCNCHAYFTNSETNVPLICSTN